MVGVELPAIYPALMLALHASCWDSEIRHVQWARTDLLKAFLTVGRSKTEASEGRVIPLNAALLEALVDHAKWYMERFGETRPEWYVSPLGNPRSSSPARPMTTLKTGWRSVRTKTGEVTL